MFNNTIIEHSDNLTFHFVNIESYSDDLKKLITSELSNIWNGDNDEMEDIQIVKAEIRAFLNDKKDERQKHGIVSEFICHLYLRQQNHKQHFLFRNLEEKGMKKGFDGVYLKDDLLWIYESKSTLPTTISDHNSNISEAYNDVKKKIEGSNTTNNPWKNAYTHANNYAVPHDVTLLGVLRDYSNQYVKEEYHDISNFNIIPSSTIFLGEKWINIDDEELFKKLEKLTKKYTSKRLNLLCVNKKTIDEFLNLIISE
jgi:hypothetical protein